MDLSQSSPLGHSVDVPYKGLLKEFWAAEARGADYCRAYAQTFPEGSVEGRLMGLLAKLEVAVAELLATLLVDEGSTREQLALGLTTSAALPPLTTSWRQMLVMVLESVPRYVERLEQLRSMAPAADREFIDTIVQHEVAIGEWARAAQLELYDEAGRTLAGAISEVEAHLKRHADRSADKVS